MGDASGHRFGQIIGDLLEEIVAPELQRFCDERRLYLDRKGARGKAREGKKVTWQDKYGNDHDLDFVIEKDGSKDVRGRPVAFIESAWRRYTKHSRNKAQEIQGAVLPIAEKHEWDRPFLGVVLAGVFTEGSLTQMRSSGFEVVLFPYESIVAAFASVGIDAEFDESTPDATFRLAIDQIEAMSAGSKYGLMARLIGDNQERISQFLDELRRSLDRVIARIIVLPLFGAQSEFSSVRDARLFVESYQESEIHGDFRKFEIIVRYSNGDSIDAEFENKADALRFLEYVSG